jgi:hypothetical protein
MSRTPTRVKPGVPGAGTATRTIPGYRVAWQRARGPRAGAGRGKSTCPGSAARRTPGMASNGPDIAVGVAAAAEVAGADEDPAAHERSRRQSRIALSDAGGHGERAHYRRYARQPGRSDGWLAPRQTGCSASGHSRSPTALPTLWICRWARTLAATGLAAGPPGGQRPRRSGQPRGPGFTSGPRGAAPRPRFRPARRPALSDRRQGKSCSSAAGRLRPGAAGMSPAVSLAEHRVESGVGPDLPDLLRAAAGDGDLGSPPQRLLA